MSVFQNTINAIIVGGSIDNTSIGNTTRSTANFTVINTNDLEINDTIGNDKYIFGVSELTADRIITLPLLNSNDIFVFQNHTQTLTNKTIVGSTNSVEASQFQTLGAPVIINTTSPSGAGEVLLSTSTTNATWTAISSGGNVLGPGTSTNNALVRWDGITGTMIKNSSVILDNTNNINGVNTIDIAVSINDSSSNEIINITATGLAVNNFTIANAATGTNPTLSATGNDIDIGIDFQTKGTGVNRFLATSTAASEIRVFEDTTNGINYTGIKAADLISTSTTFTLPSTDGISNDVLTTDGGGILSFTTLSSFIAIRIFSDQKASGTDGGTFLTGAWRTRNLNTSTGNMTGTSLIANQFTLPIGNYLIEATVPAYQVDIHQARLQNITDVTTELFSITSETLTSSGSSVQTNAIIRGYITISTPKVFELQHQNAQTRATDGFGRAAGFVGNIEVYSTIKVFKI